MLFINSVNWIKFLFLNVFWRFFCWNLTRWNLKGLVEIVNLTVLQMFFFSFLCWLFLTVIEKKIFLRYILSQDEHYFISFILDKVLVVNNKRNQLKIKGIMLVKMVIVSFFWGGTCQLVIELVIFSAYHLRRDLDTWNLNLHFLTKHLSGKNEIL